jgi:hypothetical protein
MGKPKKGSVVVLVGTRKGAIILKSDARRFGTETGQVFYTREEGKQWNLFNNLLPPILSVEAAVI